jgi:hypothetical protein
MAELLGRGKGFVGLCDVWRIEALLNTKINLIGGVHTAQMQCEFFGLDRTDRDAR